MRREETTTEPVLVSDGYDSMSAFVQGGDGGVLARHRSASGWSASYEVLGGGLITPIAAVSEGVGRSQYAGIARLATSGAARA